MESAFRSMKRSELEKRPRRAVALVPIFVAWSAVSQSALSALAQTRMHTSNIGNAMTDAVYVLLHIGHGLMPLALDQRPG
jgi:hypothetical protein